MIRSKHSDKPKKKSKVWKIISRTLLILVMLVVILLGAGVGFILTKLDTMQQVDLDDSKLGIYSENGLSNYRNIALFGVDSRDDDYGVGNRSDCIIIASINEKTKEVKLISVYRDTYLQIEGYGLDKATHAYSYGGPERAINMLNTNLDLNITEFVTVNWSAVADAVDELGRNYN